MSTPIQALDPLWFRRAAEYQACLTMPPGALGRLLDVGQQLCAIQQTLQPSAEPAVIVVMAGDHGVAEEGVSAYPQEVTGQMVANFLRGGAAINVLARRQKARVLVVDMGIKNPSVLNASLPHPDYISDLTVARGTANFLRSPAMTTRQAQQAQVVGRRVVTDHLIRPGVRVVGLGDIGIGNTTSASALAAALTGLPAAEVTGRGTGVDLHRWRRKVRVVEKALDLHFSNRHGPVDPDEALWALGGFEIAGLAGVAREAAAQRMLVILDGFISSVAGLIAVRQDPAVLPYLVAAHRSVEVGHRAVLEALNLNPMLDLEMRLGEGSGAALTLNLIHCATDIMRDMATVNAAGVSSRFA